MLTHASLPRSLLLNIYPYSQLERAACTDWLILCINDIIYDWHSLKRNTILYFKICLVSACSDGTVNKVKIGF